ncbi:GTPase of the mitochondrial inner membrane that associates with the large ribosomal subunit [Coemansia sp. Benny D115]|nr:GTPase of the mitochondrial inner membrane that associates with the large ribosomal subunit [Coemansia sp. Benny D115]
MQSAKTSGVRLVKGGRNFIDKMRCTAVGGHGGDGCVSFFRDVYVPRGPPNGGDGGSGGDVWLEVDESETSLSCVKQQLRARPGANGRGKGMHGARGADLVVRVPRGTLVRELERSVEPVPKVPESGGLFLEDLAQRVAEQELEERMDKSSLFVHYPRWEDRNNVKDVRIPPEYAVFSRAAQMPVEADLVDVGQRVRVAAGGLGGLGNPHFVDRRDKQPHYALRGLGGHVRELELELKTIADVGLVGLPNAGKSTFLRAVSNAHPRVAAYAFTTLNPYVGTIDYADARQVTVADIPGLVPGAHRNVGLGHAFLRHVERSRALVYVIDVAGAQPWADLEALRTELELHRTGLTRRPSLIIANKADMGARARDNFALLRGRVPLDTPLVPVSAMLGKNILRATHAIREVLGVD